MEYTAEKIKSTIKDVFNFYAVVTSSKYRYISADLDDHREIIRVSTFVPTESSFPFPEIQEVFFSSPGCKTIHVEARISVSCSEVNTQSLKFFKSCVFHILAC